MIYMFGNGTGKMRGSLEGSRVTSSWQSVLITTGENNILEYTNSQGSAARVIPITNFKFINKGRDYFASMNQNVEKFYGSIGFEFFKRWKQHANRFKGRFEELAKSYQALVSNNDVMRRIALHYVFIVFVAEVINDLFQNEKVMIPIDSLKELFLTICSENNHVDRAKNTLIEILEELDANRNHVFQDYLLPNAIHAISNQKGLFLKIDFLRKKLKENHIQIREAWQSKHLTIEQKQDGKSVDYKTITHKGQSFRVVQVNQRFIEQENFNFSIKTN